MNYTWNRINLKEKLKNFALLYVNNSRKALIFKILIISFEAAEDLSGFRKIAL